MDIVYLTQDRYDELQKELDNLKKEGRGAVAERLKHAKELGDLSENSEYQEAREEQSRLERRINEIEEILRNSSIIKKSKGADTVRIGSKVRIKKGGEEVVYTIVGSNEANPALGLISNESPVGRALLGKKVGEETLAQTIKGELPLSILEVL